MVPNTFPLMKNGGTLRIFRLVLITEALVRQDNVDNLVFFSVAGVPGFTAAMVRHLHSLRRMQRDHGWIHTLLEEAENERMHLMTFLQLRNPGPLFGAAVQFTQFVFTGAFFLSYMVSQCLEQNRLQIWIIPFGFYTHYDL